MSKRRRFTSDFKARVALEALRGDKTIQEIAARHKVHPNQVGAWKKQALEGLGSIFE
ncbi:MAG: transposase, partial [Thiolinea sp.]